MKTDYKPQYAERFWYEPAYEYMWFERIMPDGTWIMCDRPTQDEQDDYYAIDPKELTKKGKI